jgi:hypothetical protein
MDFPDLLKDKYRIYKFKSISKICLSKFMGQLPALPVSFGVMEIGGTSDVEKNSKK